MTDRSVESGVRVGEKIVLGGGQNSEVGRKGRKLLGKTGAWQGRCLLSHSWVIANYENHREKQGYRAGSRDHCGENGEPDGLVAAQRG